LTRRQRNFLNFGENRKKQEWIENLRRRGIEVNLEEIKKRENNKEPLEWELQLISKDNETKKLIFEILSQKNEIEIMAKQKERPEDYLKDLKDLTTSSNPFSAHFESEREKERQKKKMEKVKKLEKQFKEDEKKWERHEEDKEREIAKEIHFEEDLNRKKRRLMEKDLNYDSEEEKRKIKSNQKKYEERRQMRIKEKEIDDLMRKRENPNYREGDNSTGINSRAVMNDDITDLVLIDNDNNFTSKEPEAKATVIVQEYHYEDDFEENENINKEKDFEMFNINLEPVKKSFKPIIQDDYDNDNDDPYHKRENLTKIEINPETEKEILEMKKEVLKFNQDDEEDKVKPKSKFELQNPNMNTMNNNFANLNPSSEKLMELHKQIFEMIPKNKDELFKFPINWSLVYKYNILENKIKPWLGKKLKEYLGEDEPTLIAMIIKKLANKSSPYEIMEKFRIVLDEDTEVKLILLYL
jgi:RNA-binding protein 25